MSGGPGAPARTAGLPSGLHPWVLELSLGAVDACPQARRDLAFSCVQTLRASSCPSGGLPVLTTRSCLGSVKSPLGPL